MLGTMSSLVPATVGCTPSNVSTVVPMATATLVRQIPILVRELPLSIVAPTVSSTNGILTSVLLVATTPATVSVPRVAHALVCSRNSVLKVAVTTTCTATVPTFIHNRCAVASVATPQVDNVMFVSWENTTATAAAPTTTAVTVMIQVHNIIGRATRTVVVQLATVRMVSVLRPVQTAQSNVWVEMSLFVKTTNGTSHKIVSTAVPTVFVISAHQTQTRVPTVRQVTVVRTVSSMSGIPSLVRMVVTTPVTVSVMVRLQVGGLVWIPSSVHKVDAPTASIATAITSIPVRCVVDITVTLRRVTVTVVLPELTSAGHKAGTTVTSIPTTADSTVITTPGTPTTADIPQVRLPHSVRMVSVSTVRTGSSSV